MRLFDRNASCFTPELCFTSGGGDFFTASELYRKRWRIEIYQPYNLHKSLSAINRWWQAIAHDLWRRALTATVPVRSYPLG